MFVDIAADLLARRVGVSDLADIGREEKDFEVVLLVYRDRPAIFLRVRRQNQSPVWTRTHFSQLLVNRVGDADVDDVFEAAVLNARRLVSAEPIRAKAERRDVIAGPRCEKCLDLCF